MKNLFLKRKALIITVALLIGIFSTATTYSYFTDSTTAKVSVSFGFVDTQLIDEQSGEVDYNTTDSRVDKVVYVSNKESNIPVLVRAKVLVSPGQIWSADNIDIYSGEKEIIADNGNSNGSGWTYYEGYFYYTSVVVAGGETGKLMTSVDTKDYSEQFELTVYQEAISYPENLKDLSVENIHNLFAKAE